MADWHVAIVNRLFDFLRREKKGIKAEKFAKDFGKVTDIAKELVDNGYLSIDCFFLMISHNGIKKINPHVFKFRTIGPGYYREWLMPNLQPTDYRNVEMDQEYHDLLSRINVEKEWHIEVDKMLEGRLKTEMDHLGLRFVSFHYIEFNDDLKYYVMVGTTQYGEFFSSAHHNYQIGRAVNKVKYIVQKYYEKYK